MPFIPTLSSSSGLFGSVLEISPFNALSRTSPGFALRMGDVGTVLETLGNNEAFLVEFNKNGKAKTNECDWLGVLYPAEIEMVDTRQA